MYFVSSGRWHNFHRPSLMIRIWKYQLNAMKGNANGNTMADLPHLSYQPEFNIKVCTGSRAFLFMVEGMNAEVLEALV